jgi:hypothetical protein
MVAFPVLGIPYPVGGGRSLAPVGRLSRGLTHAELARVSMSLSLMILLALMCLFALALAYVYVAGREAG